jgi:hypothetical protein
MKRIIPKLTSSNRSNKEIETCNDNENEIICLLKDGEIVQNIYG